MSSALWPHGLQHARLPCPSPTPGVYPNSCPSSQWCHPAISSSVVPFYSCPQSLPASGSFPMSQLFTWGGQSIIKGNISIRSHHTIFQLMPNTLLLGCDYMTSLDSIFKSRDITLPTKVRLVKAMGFPVVMYGCESWTVKKAECQTLIQHPTKND